MLRLTTKRKINFQKSFPTSTTSSLWHFAGRTWANRLICNSAFPASPFGLACLSYRKRLILSNPAARQGGFF